MPPADEVSAELGRLPLTRGAADAPLRAELTARGERIELVLVDGRGAVLGRRDFAAIAACAEMARTLATEIAVWHRDYSAEVDLPLRLRARARPGLELGVHFRGAGNGAGFAAGGVIEGLLTIGPGGRVGPGVRLAVGGVAPQRGDPLGDGRAEWTRVIVTPGLNWRLGRGRLFVDWHADAVFSALQLGGVGDYATVFRRWVFDPGVGAGVRLGARLGRRLVVYLGGSVVVWPRRQEAAVAGLDETQLLPVVEGTAVVGLAVSAW